MKKYFFAIAMCLTVYFAVGHIKSESIELSSRNEPILIAQSGMTGPNGAQCRRSCEIEQQICTKQKDACMPKDAVCQQRNADRLKECGAKASSCLRNCPTN